MNRCLHCGESVRGIVCADYPECTVIKGMYPRASVPNSGAELPARDLTEPLQENQPDQVPPAIRTASESEVSR